MIRPCRLISMRHVATEIAISFAVLLCAANGAAQTSRVGASLEGTVSDSSGAKILQAVITLRNTLTNQSRTVTTDDQGFFRADQLAVGTYEIRLEHTYFAPYRRAGVTLSLGRTFISTSFSIRRPRRNKSQSAYNPWLQIRRKLRSYRLWIRRG